MTAIGIPSSGPSRKRTFRDEVNAELVRYLYRQATSSNLALLVVGAIFAYALWDAAHQSRLIGWLVACCIVAGLRFAQIIVFKRRAPTNDRITHWASWSAAGSLLWGGLWAVACFLFLDPAEPISLITITVIIMGVSAGAIVNLASYQPSFWAVVGPPMGSLIGVLLWHGGSAGDAVALLAAIATIAYVVGARNVNRLLTESLELGFENVALRRIAEERTALLEATLKNMRQGISLSDSEGRLRMWNPQFVDLLGVSPESVREQTPMEQVLSNAHPPVEIAESTRAEYRRHDGVFVEVAKSAMPDGGSVITYTDITDLKRREAALEDARHSAEQANSAKTRFLAAASHDLRQPVHALGLLFTTLADRVRSGATAPLLSQIDSAIEAIESMLGTFLDISMLDAGVVQPEIESIALGPLLHQLGNENQAIARSAANDLRVHAASVVVLSDRAMLRQILDNLISNALRYTDSGRVVVGALRRGDMIRIVVHDNGPGIPAHAIDDIFVEFHQLGNPERDRRKGLGLGLAIVKRLTNLLGHRIDVRSTVGRGSCFSVTVPISRQVPRGVEPALTTGGLGMDLQGRRVLVLDDDYSVLDAMRGLLEQWGCIVFTASSPEEAKESFMAEPVPPDLLIVDHRLRNNESGIEALSTLERMSDAPIRAIVITGDTAPDRLREAQESGYPLLHKPVRPARLRSVMRQVLRDRSPRIH